MPVRGRYSQRNIQLGSAAGSRQDPTAGKIRLPVERLGRRLYRRVAPNLDGAGKKYRQRGQGAGESGDAAQSARARAGARRQFTGIQQLSDAAPGALFGRYLGRRRHHCAQSSAQLVGARAAAGRRHRRSIAIPTHRARHGNSGILALAIAIRRPRHRVARQPVGLFVQAIRQAARDTAGLFYLRLRAAHLPGGRCPLHGGGRPQPSLARFAAASLLQRYHRPVEVFLRLVFGRALLRLAGGRDPGAAVSPLDLARTGCGARTSQAGGLDVRIVGLADIGIGGHGALGAGSPLLLLIPLQPPGCLRDPGAADIAGHLSDSPGAVRGDCESGRLIPAARLERRCRPRVVGAAVGLGIVGHDLVDRRHGYLPVRPLSRGVVRHVSRRRRSSSVANAHRQREIDRGGDRNAVRRVRGIFGQQSEDARQCQCAHGTAAGKDRGYWCRWRGWCF